MPSQISHVLHHGNAPLEALVQPLFHDRPEAGRGGHGRTFRGLDARPKVAQEAQRGLDRQIMIQLDLWLGGGG
eukprot:463529-Alexandrium_andersonii.AAC.1